MNSLAVSAAAHDEQDAETGCGERRQLELDSRPLLRLHQRSSFHLHQCFNKRSLRAFSSELSGDLFDSCCENDRSSSKKAPCSSPSLIQLATMEEYQRMVHHPHHHSSSMLHLPAPIQQRTFELNDHEVAGGGGGRCQRSAKSLANHKNCSLDLENSQPMIAPHCSSKLGIIGDSLATPGTMTKCTLTKPLAAEDIPVSWNSTGSEPTEITKIKRDLWKVTTVQSFDDRLAENGRSNSCSHLAAISGSGATKRALSGRRAAFCVGGTSRAYANMFSGHDSPLSMIYCSVPGCTGHPSCSIYRTMGPMDEIRRNQKLFKSPQNSFDSNTDVAQISVNWMRMNGVVQPFRHILQPATANSLSTTPIPTHRQLVAPTIPAAVAAANTAATIITSAGEQLSSSTTALTNVGLDLNTIPCHAVSKERAHSSTSLSHFAPPLLPPNASHHLMTTGSSSCKDPTSDIIIIEPTALSAGHTTDTAAACLLYGERDEDAGGGGGAFPRKSTSLLFASGGEDVEAQKIGNNISGSGKSADDFVGYGNQNDDVCSVKQPLVNEDLSRDSFRGGRLIRRQHLFNARKTTCDYALAVSLIGIAFMVIQNEFAYVKAWEISKILQWMIVFSTTILLGLVMKFHVHEIQIFMNANSAEDWKIALTLRRCAQILMEIITCGLCPLPIDLIVSVTSVNTDGRNIQMRLPLNTFFSIMMFFRLYWLCRVLLLHSRLFTDAASRSIAGLNRVKTDSRFILKTMMTICPGQMLMIFTATLWIIGGYILRLCERHIDDGDIILNPRASEKHQEYLNSLWLIAVTFLSIGYGDIVPHTQCGRVMSVVTGILGTCTSSMVVAVIARKLELTRAEKHVHNFMTETKHIKDLKHIAANVLRETWLIYKNRRLVDKIEPSKIRYHQRKFLVAICALRKLKTKQRKLEENRISLGDVAKTTSSSHELVREVHSTQEGLALRMTAVEHQLSDIQRELTNVSELLRYLVRPYEYTFQQQTSTPHGIHQQQSPNGFPQTDKRKGVGEPS